MKTLVIGIGGGSASGKTTVVSKIMESLAGQSVALIDEDSYYNAFAELTLEERKRINFDHPDAFDHPLMMEQIKELKEGNAIEKPIYSFIKCTRESATTRVIPARIVIVEGILVLDYKPLRELMDLKIFVDTDDDIRLARRLKRDIRERGRDFEEIIEQYFKTVRPMHHSFVLPSKRHADIIIPHGGNNIAAIEMVIAALRQKLVQY